MTENEISQGLGQQIWTYQRMAVSVRRMKGHNISGMYETKIRLRWCGVVEWVKINTQRWYGQIKRTH